MVTGSQPVRSRPRLTPAAGLAAAFQGVAFAVLMLAGLGLLLVMLASVSGPRSGSGSWPWPEGCDLERAPERIEQQPRANAAPLRLGVNRKARQHQQRDRMARHALDDALRRVRMMNLARDDRVEADNLAAGHRDVGLRRICLLGAQRMTDEKAMKLRLSAGELLDGVGAIEL